MTHAEKLMKRRDLYDQAQRLEAQARELRLEAKQLGDYFECEECDRQELVALGKGLPQGWREMTCWNDCCESYLCPEHAGMERESYKCWRER